MVSFRLWFCITRFQKHVSTRSWESRPWDTRVLTHLLQPDVSKTLPGAWKKKDVRVRPTATVLPSTAAWLKSLYWAMRVPCRLSMFCLGWWLVSAGRCSGECGRAQCWVSLRGNDSPRNVNERRYFFSPGCPCGCFSSLRAGSLCTFLDSSWTIFNNTEFQNAFLDVSLIADALFCACDTRHRVLLQQQKVQQEPQRRLGVNQCLVWEARLHAGMADSQQDSLTPSFA